jgi:ribosome-associated protein
MPTVPDPTPGGIEVAPGVRIAESALRVQFSRSGGPGGQNVNKLATKAELWVGVGQLALDEEAAQRLRQLAGRRLTMTDDIHIAADTFRTQEQNRAAAMERLRELIIQALHKPKKRRRTRPSRGSRRARLDAKRRRGQVKAGRRLPGDD